MDTATHEHISTLNNKKVLRVLLAGVGGSGSRMLVQLTALHKGLRAQGGAGLHVEVADPKRVSVASLVRQNFLESEVGLYKAHALTTRINRALGLHWEGHAQNAESLASEDFDLIISALDSGQARRSFGEAFGLLGPEPSRHCAYHVDLGNERDFGQWLLGGSSLPLPYFEHPALLKGGDVGPSCSALESLLKQDLFINDALALFTAHTLWGLLLEGKTRTRGGFVNLGNFALSGLPIPAAELELRHAAD